MSAAEKQFEKALQIITSPPPGGKKVKLDLRQKLHFYALFKQATEGPCRGKAPSRFNVIGYAKHQAWTKLGKMPKEEAMSIYVEEAKKVMPPALKAKM